MSSDMKGYWHYSNRRVQLQSLPNRTAAGHTAICSYQEHASSRESDRFPRAGVPIFLFLQRGDEDSYSR